MKTKNTQTWGILIFALTSLLLIAMAFFVPPVQAQESTPPQESSCLVCHDNLYYLYDTGKWFCQCETQMTCTCCHAGNPDSLQEQEAHLGMVLYPTRNDATACQQCHPDDYKDRAVRFSEIAGLSQIHSLSQVPTTSLPIETDPVSLTSVRELEPWRIGGLIATSIAFVVLIVFAYRCWKADCLAREPH